MLWPLSVVLVANTNGQLAIPALAGLLVGMAMVLRSCDYMHIMGHWQKCKNKRTEPVMAMLVNDTTTW